MVEVCPGANVDGARVGASVAAGAGTVEDASAAGAAVAAGAATGAEYAAFPDAPETSQTPGPSVFAAGTSSPASSPALAATAVSELDVGADVESESESPPT